MMCIKDFPNKTLLGASLLMVLGSWTAAAAHPQTVDIFPGNGQVEFAIKHAHNFGFAKLVGPALQGKFDRFHGQVTYDPTNIAASSIRWEVEVSSINTGIEKRDHHLATADYFDAKQWPTLKFVSQSVRPVDARHFEVTGQF